MEHSTTDRRGFLGHAVAGGLALSAWPAQALDAPAGKVILTVSGTTVKAGALNDYRIDIPAPDLVKHGAMLAYLLDEKPMSVREKGPLVIIYPFDDQPELRSAVHYSRAVWQLRTLELR